MTENLFVEWGLPYGSTFLAAGPCSAESKDQVLKVAHALAGRDLGFFRAGLWKPRTRPGSFEGVGTQGIDWLIQARAETGLKVGTEVADPHHVEVCLERGLDVLWIGARTTTNPFSVQALADALRGTDVPVFVKNPMNEDIGLWIGALERLSNAGVKRLGAIHRGVGSSLEMRYRNAPAWRMPIELKRVRPDLPILCDPSHICGKSEWVPLIAQEAMDLLFDGLMVEVHSDPLRALSDSAQQLNPEAFFQMVESLNIPSEEGGHSVFRRNLSALREAVDEVDSQLLDILDRRMDLVREMGKLKARENVSTLQPHRWQSILDDRIRKGCSVGLSGGFVKELMQLIHEEAIRTQEARRHEDDARE